MKRRKTPSERNPRDLAEAPEAARARAEELAEIQAVDVLMRTLDEARKSAGLTKAALAGRAKMPNETVRKLFTSQDANPAVKTLNRLAGPLGLRLTLSKRA
jgi:DNA-binding phage protein